MIDDPPFVMAIDAQGRSFRLFTAVDDRFDVDDAGDIVQVREKVSGTPAEASAWPENHPGESVHVVGIETVQ